MEMLPGVAQHPTIGGAAIGLAFLISYIMTKPSVLGQTMAPLARFVVIGGTCVASYIMFDLVIRMWD
tara:strand:+ start:4173 stop:4373 length:201 start_codon:yes stop_codon:yes gene_type:complete